MSPDLFTECEQPTDVCHGLKSFLLYWHLHGALEALQSCATDSDIDMGRFAKCASLPLTSQQLITEEATHVSTTDASLPAQLQLITLFIS